MTSAAKVLQFPMAGVARDMDYRKAYIPSEGAAFATPFAVNVIGECALAERSRGGSRPGLKNYAGTQPDYETARWLWPNGDYIDWSGATTSRITFTATDQTLVLPDGSVLFDPHETFNVMAAKGSVPSGLTAMAKYRARLVVAKDAMWYASRQADVTDFDYGGDGEDTGRACAGNVALADRKGENITAIAALEDQFLVVATRRQIRLLAGEPTEGTWATASEFTGIISRDAWCWDSQTLWFMGDNGLYALVPADGVAKKASGRLPKDFKGWSEATLVYDAEKRGIHIFGKKAAAGDGVEAVGQDIRSDWFYDIGNGAFWPMEYPSAIAPTGGALVVDGGVNKVIFKCADGAWRHWDDETATDGGTAMASKVAIGPLRASGRDDMDGMLAELDATLAESSANVTVKIFTAHSPEAAVKSAEANGADAPTFSISTGWNPVIRTRQRGAWVVIVLSSTGRWGYESMTAVCKMFGRLRV